MCCIFFSVGIILDNGRLFPLTLNFSSEIMSSYFSAAPVVGAKQNNYGQDYGQIEDETA